MRQSVVFHVVVIVFSFLVTPAVLRAEYVNFTGGWQRSFDGLVFDLHQYGVQVQGTADAASFYHQVTGNVYGDQANLTIERTNKYNGCTTYMQAYALYFNPNSIEINITGTDGRCDLSPYYRESFYYYRVY